MYLQGCQSRVSSGILKWFFNLPKADSSNCLKSKQLLQFTFFVLQTSTISMIFVIKKLNVVEYVEH